MSEVFGWCVECGQFVGRACCGGSSASCARCADARAATGDAEGGFAALGATRAAVRQMDGTAAEFAAVLDAIVGTRGADADAAKGAWEDTWLAAGALRARIDGSRDAARAWLNALPTAEAERARELEEQLRVATDTVEARWRSVAEDIEGAGTRLAARGAHEELPGAVASAHAAPDRTTPRSPADIHAPSVPAPVPLPVAVPVPVAAPVPAPFTASAEPLTTSAGTTIEASHPARPEKPMPAPDPTPAPRVTPPPVAMPTPPPTATSPPVPMPDPAPRAAPPPVPMPAPAPAATPPPAARAGTARSTRTETPARTAPPARRRSSARGTIAAALAAVLGTVLGGWMITGSIGPVASDSGKVAEGGPGLGEVTDGDSSAAAALPTASAPDLSSQSPGLPDSVPPTILGVDLHPVGPLDPEELPVTRIIGVPEVVPFPTSFDRSLRLRGDAAGICVALPSPSHGGASSITLDMYLDDAGTDGRVVFAGTMTGAGPDVGLALDLATLERLDRGAWYRLAVTGEGEAGRLGIARLGDDRPVLEAELVVDATTVPTSSDEVCIQSSLRSSEAFLFIDNLRVDR